MLIYLVLFCCPGTRHDEGVAEVRWKVRQLLDANNITPYRLWKESGLARATVYALAKNEGERVDLGTLNTVLTTLEGIINRPLEIGDVLERVQ